jgi:predicted amidohydrolase YtcJ
VRYGITSVQSMPSAHPDRLAPLVAQTDVPLRWRWIEVEMGTVPHDPKWPTKYIADGTPVERNAAMREPYSDQPNTRGAMNFTDDQIHRAIEVAAHSKQQLLFHAAGELPIEKFFAAMKSIRADWPAKRVRVEHGDFIGNYLPDAKRLGVIVVQNPSHFMIADIVRARFGSERLKNFQAFRSLIEARIPVAIGSDGPINPWLNIMFATMHPTNPKEAITVEQALIAYTRGSARAEFEEHEKGTIEVGALADLAVLSQDIFKVPPPDLPKTESVLTIIDGRVVYEGASGR